MFKENNTFNTQKDQEDLKKILTSVNKFQEHESYLKIYKIIRKYE